MAALCWREMKQDHGATGRITTGSCGRGTRLGRGVLDSNSKDTFMTSKPLKAQKAQHATAFHCFHCYENA